MPAYSKKTSNYIVPVLAGGGTRFPSHVGIIKALEDLSIGYDHIVGISGGSIVASFVALGRQPDELYNLATSVDFNRFRGYSLFSLVFDGGLSTGDKFEKWMDNELEGATFSDLLLDLHIVATDVKSQRPVIFDKNNTPDLKVSTAVRYSMESHYYSHLRSTKINSWSMAVFLRKILCTLTCYRMEYQ